MQKKNTRKTLGQVFIRPHRRRVQKLTVRLGKNGVNLGRGINFRRLTWTSLCCRCRLLTRTRTAVSTPTADVDIWLICPRIYVPSTLVWYHTRYHSLSSPPSPRHAYVCVFTLHYTSYERSITTAVDVKSTNLCCTQLHPAHPISALILQLITDPGYE